MALSSIQYKPTLLAGVLLVAAVAFNLVVLHLELSLDAPDLNDNVLHYALIERTVEAVERGEDVTDHWVPYIAQGYPLFHHYQHLPHVATALLYKLLGEIVPLRTLFLGVGYLLLCTFPLSIYWTGRRLGFSALPYTQLWGMWLLGPAVAGLYLTLRHGRAYAGTVALLAATLLSHTVLGYVALVSGGLFVLLAGRTDLVVRIGRLALVLFLVSVVASYFLVPFFLDRPYMNRSVWEELGKYDAYGWAWTLKALLRGELLDAGRFPALTLLGGLGLLVCLVRGREDERYRLLPAFFGLWLLLYFGRPTWGGLLGLLPLSGDLHFHRLIAPVHLGAIGLAGAGLAWLWEKAIALGGASAEWGDALRSESRLGTLKRALQRWGAITVVGLLMPVLLIPAYRERVEYMATNNDWKRHALAALEADAGEFSALLADLRTRPPARVYAGRSVNWGKDYRFGYVPVYALLVTNQIDSPGYLYHALSLNADIEGYLNPSRPETFNLFNLRYVVAPAEWPAPPLARSLASYGRHRLYEMETSGYFDLVDSDAVLYGVRAGWFDAVRTWLHSDMVASKQHPLIVFGSKPESDSAMDMDVMPFSTVAELRYAAREPCGRMLSEKVAGNSYAVAFEAVRSCWLLFKATYHPGWRAMLDGQPVPARMLAPSFVGLKVEPGRHSAELTYQTKPIRAWLRFAGLVTLLLIVVVEWQRARSRVVR